MNYNKNMNKLPGEGDDRLNRFTSASNISHGNNRNNPRISSLSPDARNTFNRLCIKSTANNIDRSESDTPQP